MSIEDGAVARITELTEQGYSNLAIDAKSSLIVGSTGFLSNAAAAGVLSIVSGGVLNFAGTAKATVGGAIGGTTPTGLMVNNAGTINFDTLAVNGFATQGEFAFNNIGTINVANDAEGDMDGNVVNGGKITISGGSLNCESPLSDNLFTNNGLVTLSGGSLNVYQIAGSGTFDIGTNGFMSISAASGARVGLHNTGNVSFSGASGWLSLPFNAGSSITLSGFNTTDAIEVYAGSITGALSVRFATNVLAVTTGAGTEAFNVIGTYGSDYAWYGTSNGVIGVDHITATAAGQTLTAHVSAETLTSSVLGNDTMIGFASGYTTFAGTAAGLNDDTVQYFRNTPTVKDSIDIKDIDILTAKYAPTLSELTNGAITSLTLGYNNYDVGGLHGTAENMTATIALTNIFAPATAVFGLSSDGHGGTSITFHT